MEPPTFAELIDEAEATLKVIWHDLAAMRANLDITRKQLGYPGLPSSDRTVPCHTRVEHHPVKTLHVLNQPHGKYLVIEHNDGGPFPPGPLTLSKGATLAHLNNYGFREAEIQEAIRRLESHSDVTLTVP